MCEREGKKAPELCGLCVVVYRFTSLDHGVLGVQPRALHTSVGLRVSICNTRVVHGGTAVAVAAAAEAAAENSSQHTR